MRLLFVADLESALQAKPTDVQSLERSHLPPPPHLASIPTGVARRETKEASAFWPELYPQTRQQLLEKGYAEEVELAERIAPELSLAVSKGFPIPPALRERAVFEVYRVMIAATDANQRLRAVALLERMARSNDNPNALPDQLQPSASSPAGIPSVQVNIQNNVATGVGPQTGSPSVTVGELVDELLSRPDVQDALDADLPNTGEDYGI